MKAALAAARLPGRRGIGHVDLSRHHPASPPVPGGRGRGRQDRGRQGAEPLARRSVHTAAVLRGHRRQPGGLRVGPRPPAAAPAYRRGHRSDRTDGCWPARSRAVRRAVPDPRPLLEALSRTDDGSVPVLLDRRGRPRRRRVRGVPARSAVRLLGHGARSWARSPPPTRRSWSSRPTALAMCTTRSKRRCLYHWVEHPDFDREVAIVRLRAPQSARPWPARWPPPPKPCAASASTSPQELLKPSTGRCRWLRSGRTELDEASVAATLGTRAEVPRRP